MAIIVTAGKGTGKATNNGGNREPATGNRGGIRNTVMKAKAGPGTGEQDVERRRRTTFSRPPWWARVVTCGQRHEQREPATGNWGGIRNTVITAGTRDRGAGRQRPRRRQRNGELAIGSDEHYQKSPSCPGTGRSCRLFLRPAVTRCAGSCYWVSGPGTPSGTPCCRTPRPFRPTAGRSSAGAGTRRSNRRRGSR